MVIAVMGLVALLFAGLIGYMVWARPRHSQFVEVPPSEVELAQARLDIHRVAARVDVTLAGLEARREAEAAKQAIKDALREERDWW